MISGARYHEEHVLLGILLNLMKAAHMPCHPGQRLIMTLKQEKTMMGTPLLISHYRFYGLLFENTKCIR